MVNKVNTLLNSTYSSNSVRNVLFRKKSKSCNGVLENECTDFINVVAVAIFIETYTEVNNFVLVKLNSFLWDFKKNKTNITYNRTSMKSQFQKPSQKTSCLDQEDPKKTDKRDSTSILLFIFFLVLNK